MNLKKFIIPAMASVAVFTSCNSGVKLEKSQYGEAIFNGSQQTMTNIDTVDATLKLSGTKGQAIVTELDIDNAPSIQNMAKVSLNLTNASATLNAKVTNLLKYYQKDAKTVDLGKNPIMAYAELKDVNAAGTFGALLDSSGQTAVSLDFNEKIDSIKAYLKRFEYQPEDLYYGVYLDVSTSTIPSTLDDLINAAKAKSSGASSDIYSTIALYLQMAKDRLSIENKYLFDTDDHGESVYGVSQMLNTVVSKFSDDKYKSSFIENVNTAIGKIITKAGKEDIFSIVKNGESYTATITLDKTALQNLCNYGSDLSYATITSGEVKATVTTDGKNRLSNASISINNLNLSTAEISGTKVPVSFEKLVLKDFSTSLSLDVNYDTTSETITKLINDATSNEDEWAYKYFNF